MNSETLVVKPKPGRKPKVLPGLPTLPVAATPIETATAVAQQETPMTEMLHNDTADQAKAMFADVSSRAHGALDKGHDMLVEATDFSKGNVEALVASSKIAVHGFEALGHDATVYARKAIEEAATQARTLAAAKSPTEMMKLHSDYVRSAFDAMVAETSRGTEALMKLVGEVTQPISNRVAIAADKMKIAA